MPPKAAQAEGPPKGADAPINRSREARHPARPLHYLEGQRFTAPPGGRQLLAAVAASVTVLGRGSATLAGDRQRWGGGRGELGSARGMAVTGAARMARRSGVLAWALWALVMLGLAASMWLEVLLVTGRSRRGSLRIRCKERSTCPRRLDVIDPVKPSI
jgi:hypothetical protein